MTSGRRVTIATLATLVLAGCAGSGTPSIIPSGTPAVATPAATSTAEPAPTVLPSQTEPPSWTPAPEPTTCPAGIEGHEPSAILTNDAFVFWQPFVITRVARASDPSEVLSAPEPIAAAAAPQFLFGGGETDLYLQYYEASWTRNPPTVDSLRMTLDANQPDALDLPIHLEPAGYGFTAAFVDVPDITWSGPATIVAEWHDPCFVFEAMTTTWLFIDPRSSTADCATLRGPAFDELEAIFAPSIRVGPVEANLIEGRFTGKVTELSYSGDINPPYTDFSRGRPTFAAEAGATVSITPNDHGPALTSREDSEVIFFRRGALVRWLEGGWIHGSEPEATIMFRSPLVASAGGFTFTLPSEPGRYVAQPLFDYNSACSFGIAGTVVGIDVE